MDKVYELAQFLIEHIVENKKSLSIEISNPQNNVSIVNVKAAKEDIPLIIGKKGSVIRSLRCILRILSPKVNKFIDINIVES